MKSGSGERPTQTEYLIRPLKKAPRGYPAGPVPDVYTPGQSPGGYETRRRAFIRHCLANPSGPSMKGYYYELVRLHERKGPIHEGILLGALDYIEERLDCADFVMLGIVRILCQFRDSRMLQRSLVRRVEEVLLSFKYWPDEPGIDSMCTWTENHQIMFSANEYLAGQLFPERVFANSGMTGLEKIERARKRIMQWTDLRFKTGFSEWLSHIYYDEDITALVNLADFAADPVISRRSEIVLDLLFYDMALNSFLGVFGSTHGRSYVKEKKSGLVESTTDTSKLLFGRGRFAGADNMSAVALALSPRYRLPEAVYRVAVDNRTFENRQRMGIRIADASRWGINTCSDEGAMALLSLEAYTHPKTINAVMKLFDRYNWWDNRFFEMFKKMKKLIRFARVTGMLPMVAKIFEKDITRNTREEVNILTFKTPDYMLSSAQDYRHGYGGDQQHLWQATLGPEAVCFTTHPGGLDDYSAGYWVGSGTLPRVAQVRNVVIAVYRISRLPGLYRTNRLFFTHAWLPRDHFDETVERAGWICARKTDGYLALYSRNGYRPQAEGDDREREIIADGKENIWICEMGCRAENGSFTDFVDAVTGSRPEFHGLRVRYRSPSLGKVEFGWRGPLSVNGNRTELSGYKRYGNPYSNADFPSDDITIRCDGHYLRLNMGKGIRDADGYI